MSSGKLGFPAYSDRSCPGQAKFCPASVPTVHMGRAFGRQHVALSARNSSSTPQVECSSTCACSRIICSRVTRRRAAPRRTTFRCSCRMSSLSWSRRSTTKHSCGGSYRSSRGRRSCLPLVRYVEGVCLTRQLGDTSLPEEAPMHTEQEISEELLRAIHHVLLEVRRHTHHSYISSRARWCARTARTSTRFAAASQTCCLLSTRSPSRSTRHGRPPHVAQVVHMWRGLRRRGPFSR